MKKKVLSALLVTAMVATFVMGCTGSSDSKKTDPVESTKTEATEKAVETEKATDVAEVTNGVEGDIVIGFATGASGSSFRTILENNFREVADEYKAQGRLKDYKIVNNVTDWDASEQANIVRDLVNDSAINVIMVNPNSPTDLNGVLKEAVDAGKKVIVLDCEVEVEGVTCVSIDHHAWSMKAAEYIAETLGEGNAVQIYGGEGHPANNDRIQGTYDVLENYPDIKLVADTSGGWDQQVAKDVATQILGSGTTVDAIFTQDSMGAGILSAAIDLDKVPKVMFGECGTEYAKMAKQLLEDGKEFSFCTQPNPPGISATALHLAMNIAEGKEFKDGVLGGKQGRTYYYEVTKWFTQDAIEELWKLFENEADDYLLTEYLTQEQAEALFQ